ncbi:phage regulatory CII family protein [Oceanicoccus sagamiensis]|uniref:Rha family transcriptional regulator n=1 Tax=Oceanicoccus sagamiensis TaxID=716816 RepID=A0A1X9N8J9_9GAMM|nr:phage regulatory CII family protein [Oceanicoccus sagamiensis]ARN74006.1 hypothetical protein BST96_07665 [Oceanicoccus sagamiensis]
MDDIYFNITTQVHKVAKAYHKGDKRGMTGLAKALGIKDNTFNNKCDPNMKGHHLNLKEFLQIIKETGELSLLSDFAQQFNCAVYQTKDYTNTSNIELLDAMVLVDVERGETAAAIHEALDGRITAPKVDVIRKEIYQDIQKMMELLLRIDAIKDDS